VRDKYGAQRPGKSMTKHLDLTRKASGSHGRLLRKQSDQNQIASAESEHKVRWHK
jgi:hypothetical protein